MHILSPKLQSSTLWKIALFWKITKLTFQTSFSEEFAQVWILLNFNESWPVIKKENNCVLFTFCFAVARLYASQSQPESFEQQQRSCRALKTTGEIFWNFSENPSKSRQSVTKQCLYLILTSNVNEKKTIEKLTRGNCDFWTPKSYRTENCRILSKLVKIPMWSK